MARHPFSRSGIVPIAGRPGDELQGRLFRAMTRFFQPAVPAVLLILVHRLGSRRFREAVILAASELAFRLSSKKRCCNDLAMRHHLNDGLSERQLRRLVRGTFTKFWRDFFESAYFEDEQKRFAKHQVQGLQLLDQKLEQGRGCILWESHSFGRRNLAKLILAAKGYAIDQLHQEQHFLSVGHIGRMSGWQKKLGRRLDRFELRFVRKIHRIPLDGSFAYARSLLRGLQNNGVICSAADGQRGQRHIEVTCLGRPMLIATGILSLAKMSGAPILSVLCWEEDGLPQVELREIWDPSLSRETPREAAERFAKTLEQAVLSHPDQYTSWPALPS